MQCDFSCAEHTATILGCYGHCQVVLHVAKVLRVVLGVYRMKRVHCDILVFRCGLHFYTFTTTFTTYIEYNGIFSSSKLTAAMLGCYDGCYGC